MKFAYAVLLGVVTASCSKSEGAADTAINPVVKQPPVVVRHEPIPLDTLLLQLDSAHGFYWPKTTRQLELTNANLQPERFREHGRPAIQRLIECMTDTTSTAVYHGDDMSFRYPRGALCYEVLRQLVDVDESRQLPINRQDVLVSLARSDVKAELKRARRAWQVIHDARAYRMRVPAS